MAEVQSLNLAGDGPKSHPFIIVEINYNIRKPIKVFVKILLIRHIY